MKKRLPHLATFLSVTVLCCMLTTTFISADESHAPGSQDDPVVTKSYVDNAISAAIGANTGSAQGTYVPIEVSAGDTLYGSEGTEIILRSGEANTVAPGENGLVNVTGGYDQKNGEPLKQDYLLIVPRDDGRGVVAKTDCWFMVKGDYKIN